MNTIELELTEVMAYTNVFNEIVQQTDREVRPRFMSLVTPNNFLGPLAAQILEDVCLPVS